MSDATDGKVGYIHVPDMQQTGLNEFAKHYYPQLKKQALVIDVRGNGGGNVSPMLIERLRREAAMIGVARNAEPTVDPAGTFVGPMACLLNEFSASDGDIFPYRFRHHKLGPLIGKRSWGGVVGIRGSLPLLDGGTLNKPEFSRYDLGGKEWIMENVGVSPDIVVDNDPAKEFAGEDQQLNRAVRGAVGGVEEEPAEGDHPAAVPEAVTAAEPGTGRSSVASSAPSNTGCRPPARAARHRDFFLPGFFTPFEVSAITTGRSYFSR